MNVVLIGRYNQNSYMARLHCHVQPQQTFSIKIQSQGIQLQFFIAFL